MLVLHMHVKVYQCKNSALAQSVLVVQLFIWDAYMFVCFCFLSSLRQIKFIMSTSRWVFTSIHAPAPNIMVLKFVGCLCLPVAVVRGVLHIVSRRLLM